MNYIDAVYIDHLSGKVLQVVEKIDDYRYLARPISLRGPLEVVHEVYLQAALDFLSVSLAQYKPYQDVIKPDMKTTITVERRSVGLADYWLIVVFSEDGRVLAKVMDTDLRRAFMSMTVEDYEGVNE